MDTTRPGETAYTSRRWTAGLTLSIATVKTYVTRLLTKLDARDRVQLVIIAYDAGLVAPAR